MQRYILGRISQAILSLLIMSLIVFVMARLTGDPLNVLLPENATEEDRAALAAHLGLDKPLPTQYFIFIGNALHGDFGRSVKNRYPAAELVFDRFPATLELAMLAIAIAIIIAIPIGVQSAVRRGTILDAVGRVIAVLGQSTPIFWLGLMLMLFFAVMLHLVPTSGRSGPESYLLPALTMGWYPAAGFMRLVRSSMLDVLDSEYIKMARIKGVSEMAVVWKHGLKNAAIPVLTYMGVIFPHLVGGAVITETVFAWPGVGRLALEAVFFYDFPVVQLVVLLMTAIYIFANLGVDVIYAYLDPRIRYGAK